MVKLDSQFESPSFDSIAAGRTVPEFQAGAMCDPFAVDVYCLGNVFRKMFTHASDISPGMKGLAFLRPLVEEMMQDDPTERPTMDEVSGKFRWTLRARAAEKDEAPPMLGFFLSVIHWTKMGFRR
ncbi:hypothetical protein DFH09DRAFT_1368731 [Mycena vulgaris]|nr:hypothetical protein DFH09DRAFT_1368731 [Mycena vulgaris]